MKKYKIGIIGGSGFYSLKNFKLFENQTFELMTISGLKFEKMSSNKIEYFFLPRHGKKHQTLPHEIKYLKIIETLSNLNLDFVISFCTVGSLNKTYVPGSYVIPSGVLDFTKSRNGSTFIKNEKHIDIEPLFPSILRTLFLNIFKEINGLKFSNGGNLCVIEGPRFASIQEQKMYKMLGGDLLNMTQMPEIYLAKVFEVPYISLCHVTDYTQLVDKNFNILSESSLEIFNSNKEKVERILKLVANYLIKNKLYLDQTKNNKPFV